MSHLMSRATTLYPELGIEMPATHCLGRSTAAPVFTTRAEEKRREADLANKKYTVAHQISSNPLHTATYISDKGDTVFLKFDASRPCTRFSTTETRFYKPTLHKIVEDPYVERKSRGM
eukprot:GFUD01001147.1.p1 GENE.GFUD01001147.1~~GFUD01001147.1.p1  ORF type:complete len:118 (-),score=45.28 GFUD01001147.1:633-986(-)